MPRKTRSKNEGQSSNNGERRRRQKNSQSKQVKNKNSPTIKVGTVRRGNVAFNHLINATVEKILSVEIGPIRSYVWKDNDEKKIIIDGINRVEGEQIDLASVLTHAQKRRIDDDNDRGQMAKRIFLVVENLNSTDRVEIEKQIRQFDSSLRDKIELHFTRNSLENSSNAITNLWNRYKNYKQRIEDKKLTDIRLFSTNTASTVYKATTTGPIGKQGTNKGIAKKGFQANDVIDYNEITTIDTIYNDPHSLDSPYINDLKYDDIDSTLTIRFDPQLIARQVISHRVAREIGLNVITPEIFSKTEDGRTVGISAIVDGTQVLSSILPDGTPINNFFDLENPRIQKELSDLQILDAINGQMDRHSGNIFITGIGEIRGIDNDMAFPIAKAEQTHHNTLKNQFIRDQDGRLIYAQEQVDAGTAEKILAMDSENLRKILGGRKSDPEHLEEAAIENTIERFEAVKRRIQELKDNGRLIGTGQTKQWGQQTLQEAIDSGYLNNKLAHHKNYAARIFSGLRFQTAES